MVLDPNIVVYEAFPSASAVLCVWCHLSASTLKSEGENGELYAQNLRVSIAIVTLSMPALALS